MCLNRYPYVFHKNVGKLFARREEFLDYLYRVDKFRHTHPRFFDHGAVYDGQEGIFESILGRKRIQQADVDRSLGLTEKFMVDLADRCDESLFNQISKNNNDKDIIVFVNSVDQNFGTDDSTKMWPVSYWDRLVELIKNERPHFLLIQIGAGKGVKEIKGVDYNLVNRTSFAESMGILKNAKLLISNEGGMVHVRHALGEKKSIVIFGSTDERLFGYSENINLRGKGCPFPCEWNIREWQKRCINKKGGIRACTLSILPEMIMEQIDAVVG